MTETPKIADGGWMHVTEHLAKVRATMLAELDHYTTATERAAYRAGMSTAASVCDCVAAEYDMRRASHKNRRRAVVATICGNQIWLLRDMIFPPMLRARSNPQGERE